MLNHPEILSLSCHFFSVFYFIIIICLNSITRSSCHCIELHYQVSRSLCCSWLRRCDAYVCCTWRSLRDSLCEMCVCLCFSMAGGVAVGRGRVTFKQETCNAITVYFKEFEDQGRKHDHQSYEVRVCVSGLCVC